METRLSLLPLEFLLRKQLRTLEATAEAARVKMDLLPVHRKLTRRIGEQIGSVSGWLVKKPLLWLSRRRSLQWLRPALVQGRRNLVLFLLVNLIKVLRRFPGNRRR